MHILQVNKFLFNKGGSEAYMFELSNRLSKDHKVGLWGMADVKNKDSRIQKPLVSAIDFHTNAVSKILYPFKIAYSFEAKEKYNTVSKSFNPDIVHLNNFNFHLTPSIIDAAYNRGTPMVLTVHDPFLVCPSHTFYNYQTSEICELCKDRKYIHCIKTSCLHGSKARSFMAAVEGWVHHKRKTYDKINRMICPSQFMADKLIEFGVNPKQITVLHNFAGEAEGRLETDKKDYILYFGRLSKEKGISTLLEVMKATPEIQYVIAGTGPLENLIKEYLEPNMRYVGFQTGNALKMLIKGSAFTIYPSEWYENCPMSILESQGYGVPVIGARIGGIPELIREDVDGLLFESGNVEDFTAKVRRLYSDRILQMEYSTQCFAKIQDFSIDKYVEKLMIVYEEAIEETKMRTGR